MHFGSLLWSTQLSVSLVHSDSHPHTPVKENVSNQDLITQYKGSKRSPSHSPVANQFTDSHFVERTDPFPWGIQTVIWSTRGTHTNTFAIKHTHSLSLHRSQTQKMIKFSLFPKSIRWKNASWDFSRKSGSSTYKIWENSTSLNQCVCVWVCVHNIQHYSLKLGNRL